MSRALFDRLTPAEKAEVAGRLHIPVVDYDPRADARRTVASAVRASGKPHRHRQHH